MRRPFRTPVVVAVSASAAILGLVLFFVILGSPGANHRLARTAADNMTGNATRAVFRPASRSASTLPVPDGLPHELPVPATLPAELASRADLDASKALDYGNLTTPTAGVHHLFVVPRLAGGTCLVDLSAQAWGLGCGGDLFANQPVAFNETFGGHFVIAGVASPGVAYLEIVDTAGNLHRVTLTNEHAFVFQMPDTSIQAGVEPSDMIAHDSSAAVVGRIGGLAPK